MLVTGGAGELGRRVARDAAANGWDVTVTRRSSTPSADVRSVEVDLRDRRATADMVRDLDPEVVVHTAYDKSDNGPDSVTRAGTATIAAATDARLLFTSTDVVFPGRPGVPYAEGDRPAPIQDYGRAKAAAEAGLAGRPSTLIVRLSLLVDADGGPQVELVRAAARGDATLFTDEIRCPTMTDDIAAALVELADGDRTGYLHLGGPDALDRAELGRLLSSAAGVEPADLTIGPLPADAGRPADVRLDSSLAETLGLRPRSLREALSAR
ncbi:MAG: sugar nucleotide-binding protein [Actinomycetota bacterium]